MTRLPSVKKLREIFGENARHARKVLEMNRPELLDTDAGAKAHAQCYNRPGTEWLRMEVLNTLGDFHGTEGAETTRGEWLEYLNSGHTYALTLLRWRGRYIVATFGDMVERLERRSIHFS